MPLFTSTKAKRVHVESCIFVHKIVTLLLKVQPACDAFWILALHHAWMGWFAPCALPTQVMQHNLIPWEHLRQAGAGGWSHHIKVSISLNKTEKAGIWNEWQNSWWGWQGQLYQSFYLLGLNVSVKQIPSHLRVKWCHVLIKKYCEVSSMSHKEAYSSWLITNVSYSVTTSFIKINVALKKWPKSSQK